MRFLIYLIIFAIVFAITNSCITKEKLMVGASDCVDSFFNYCANTKISEKKATIKNGFGSTDTYDSLCYHIKINRSVSGNLIYSSIENQENHLMKFKDYHVNGKLKSEGYLLLPNNSRVGVWTFYSSKNKIDSIVDYEKRRKLTFCEFIQISEVKDFLNKGSYIRRDNYGWFINREEDFGSYTNEIRLFVEDSSKSIKIDTLIGIK